MGFLANIIQRVRHGPSPVALAGSGRAYDAADWQSRELGSWTPNLTSGIDEVLDSRDMVTRRARDLVRNHPIISGATDRRAESVVGPNIRLEVMPAFLKMGQSPDWADEWSAGTEQEFELWARDPRKLCDAEMQLQFGGMVEMAYRHWWNDGEAAAVVKMLPATGPRVLAQWETCVEVIDPDRIGNPRGMADFSRLGNGNTLIGGIEYDRNKAPIAAHVRIAHPSSASGGAMDNFRWKRVRFYGPTGRPIFIHAFRRKRADQRKGISQFVSAIKRVKMFDRYDDAEIEAALLNAVMAAWIESPDTDENIADALAPTSSSDGAAASLDAQMRYRMEHPVRMNGVRVIHGLPGEKAELLRAEHPSANYPEFQATGLRSMAAALGLSYAQVSQNWADINYSSARAMLNEIWRGLLHDRWLFTQSFCTPIYLAWLEEAVAKGMIAVPGRKTNFYKWRNALSLCEWMGPGRGTVDPLKEGQANEFFHNMGLVDASSIAGELGRSHDKVLFRQSREAKARERYGLAPYVPLKGGGAQAGSEPGSEDPDAADDAALGKQKREDA
jgi:lambda family phage portal protein